MSVLDIANNSTALSPGCHNAPVRHSFLVFGIVQSCAATLFLCVWVVLHPDVPKGPDDMTRVARVTYMIITLLAPELVLTMACGEWVSCAGFLRRMAQERPMCEWSETHAMFAYMGGFRFVNEDGSKDHPREVEFFRRVFEGEIEAPDIEVEDILDKSKGDGLAKAIVLLQTFWFALQAINRFVRHLPVTELEITTLAHVTINFFTYWCWWNKPLDITRPIDIYPRNSRSRAKEQSSEQLGDNDVVVAQQNEKEGAEACLLGNNNVVVAQEIEEIEISGNNSVVVTQEIEEIEISGGADGYLLGDSSVVVAQEIEELERSGGTDDHLLGDEIARAVRPRLPIRIRMGASFADADGRYMGSRTGHVIAILSGIFGGIHCLAWNSTFHTQLQSTLWRASALLVAALPFMLFSGGALTEAYHIKISSLKGKGRTLAIMSSMIKVLRNTTLSLGLIAYVFARICLLVLAILELKRLPEEALQRPSWTKYIPHI